MKYAVELMEIDDEGNCHVRAWEVSEHVFRKSERHLKHGVGEPSMESLVPAENVQTMATQAVEGSVVLKGDPYSG